jgi:hypothetical protein
MRSCVIRVALVSVCCLVGSLGGSAVAQAAAPTVTSISPNNGPAAGGTSVTIKGTGFIFFSSTVKFGGVAAGSVTVNSETSITASSPAGSGLVNVTVTDSNGTSASTPADQFAYDSAPSGPWLGLNGNSTGAYLGSIGDFTAHNIVYDRGGGSESSGNGIEWSAGELPKAGDDLEKSINAGMIPIVTIEYEGYGSHEFGEADPNFPTGTKITTYVEGFVKSAKAIREAYPGKQILFEPINEPWGYTEPGYNGAEYANIIAKLLPEAQAAGIPLGNIYVAAYGRHWVSKMYEAQSKLKTEIEGWYFHPYGPPNGTAEENGQGIQSLPNVQAEMTSGQNNIIVSEIGYWTHDVNGGESKGGPSSVWAENSTQAAQWLTETLDNALPYRQAGWLKALLVYSRNDGGWAMELSGSTLTKQGEALDNFANVYGSALWWVQPTPNPSEATHSVLSGVSCTSSSACTAVGGSYKEGVFFERTNEVALAEVWNGSSWSIQSVPKPTGAKGIVLSGVSCTSSSACTAVGNYDNSSGTQVTLAERWNGTSWSVQTTPNPAEVTYSVLNGVACTSSTACVAVGGSFKEGGFGGESMSSALAEVWNGSSWSIQSVPKPTGAKGILLSGVSCTSSSACTAVGNYNNASGTQVTLAERWNGTSWSVQTTPNPTGGTASVLSGVSCTSSSACTAVGNAYTGGFPSSTDSSLAEVWNGSSWSVQSTPNPTGATWSVLGGVSCISSLACTAVGNYVNSSGSEVTLAEIWSGSSWSVQSTPNPSESTATAMSGVSCTSAVLCTAVGDYSHVVAFLNTVSTLAESYH